MYGHHDDDHRDGLVVFCSGACHHSWATTLELPAAGTPQAVTGGPPWCLHCRTCGARCWTSPACPLCPACHAGRWTATLAATTFGAELGRHVDPAGLAEDAW